MTKRHAPKKHFGHAAGQWTDPKFQLPGVLTMVIIITVNDVVLTAFYNADKNVWEAPHRDVPLQHVALWAPLRAPDPAYRTGKA